MNKYDLTSKNDLLQLIVDYQNRLYIIKYTEKCKKDMLKLENVIKEQIANIELELVKQKNELTDTTNYLSKVVSPIIEEFNKFNSIICINSYVVNISLRNSIRVVVCQYTLLRRVKPIEIVGIQVWESDKLKKMLNDEFHFTSEIDFTGANRSFIRDNKEEDKK